MRIVGLVTARGGSKGIPRKNLAHFAGRPLLEWTCEAARGAAELDALMLSTDDEEMAAEGRRWGAEVPFLRPAELARDDTPSLPVVQHALRALDRVGRRFDAVCLLQPTNPLRTAHDIDEACRLFRESRADSVVSVVAVPSHFHPMWCYLLDGEGELKQACGTRVVPRRQELPPAYTRDGSLYVTRREVLLGNEGSLYGSHIVPYFIAEERSGGIDTPADLELLERRVRN